VQLQEEAMQEYTCSVCGYVYTPEEGDRVNDIVAGTPFEELPVEWICPQCDAPKDLFGPAE
jgi:rubredoxin